MASDEDYMAFLNAASSGIEGGKAKAATGQEARCKTMDEGVEVPEVLGKVCKEAVYESDADEPFVKVGLRYHGSDGLPDEGMSTTAAGGGCHGRTLTESSRVCQVGRVSEGAGDAGDHHGSCRLGSAGTVQPGDRGGT